MASPIDHDENVSGDFDALDRVESARDRLVSLLAKSTVVPDAIQACETLRTSNAHTWCFWVRPQAERPALLFSGEWTLSGFFLAALFSRVQWWDTDPQRAAMLAEIAAEIEPSMHIEHCLPTQVVHRLKAVAQPLGLVALQEAFGQIPRWERALRRETLHRLSQAVSSHGQCFVISRSRLAASQRMWQIVTGVAGEALPTVKEIRKGLDETSDQRAKAIFFHPDHRNPAEILEPPDLLPRAHRRRLMMQLLKRIGVVERLLGSFACFLPDVQSATMIDEMIGHLASSRRTPGTLKWRDGTVRNSSMIFITVDIGKGDEAILRIPLTRDAASALSRVDEAYNAVLGQLPWLGRLIPEASPLLRVHGWPTHLERKCHGVSARQLIDDAVTRKTLRDEVMAFVTQLCRATVNLATVDDTFIATHVRSNFNKIRGAAPELAPRLVVVETALTDLIRGHRLPLARIHGDVTVDNLFFDPTSLALSGVIDWEFSLPDALPIDFLHYLVAESRALSLRPWGMLVSEAVFGRLLDPDARQLLIRHLAAIGLDEQMLPALLVAYWARGIALRIDLSAGRLAPSWQKENLAEPLEPLASYLAGDCSRS